MVRSSSCDGPHGLLFAQCSLVSKLFSIECLVILDAVKWSAIEVSLGWGWGGGLLLLMFCAAFSSNKHRFDFYLEGRQSPSTEVRGDQAPSIRNLHDILNSAQKVTDTKDATDITDDTVPFLFGCLYEVEEFFLLLRCSAKN